MSGEQRWLHKEKKALALGEHGNLEGMEGRKELLSKQGSKIPGWREVPGRAGGGWLGPCASLVTWEDWVG